METRIFVCKNIKNIEAKKAQLIEKLKIMVSHDVTISGDTIVIIKKGTWSDSKGIINITKKGNDLEFIYANQHTASTIVYLLGCLHFC